MSPGDEAAPVVLDVAALTVSYATRRGRLNALADVSFAIRAGETLALVGESGSGKSTASLAIMGLLGPEATIHGGRMAFNGQDLARLAPHERAALRGDRISIVFQDPFTSLNPGLPIGLQVAEPLIFHRAMPEAAALAKAVDALAEVGLPNPQAVARAYPHQLSGGMQQRALIATALVCDPALVILDEPTTALDVTVEAQILDLLDELRRRRGLSMLFITHNLGLVNRICNTVCVLYAGSVIEYGPTAQVLTRPAHPYTRGLLTSMPRLDVLHRRARLIPIAGKFPDLTRMPPGCVFHPRCAHAEAACRDTAQTLAPIASAHAVRCWKSNAILALQPTIASPQRHPVPPRAAAGTGEWLLEVKALRKTYRLGGRLARARLGIPGTRGSIPWLRFEHPEVNAVAGVSLAVGAGETLGLVGESGCGKSTLGRCVVRLLDPSGGTVLFRGRDVGSEDRKALRTFRGLAQIVFQNPVSSLNPRKTVGAAIDRSLANFARLSPRDALARRTEILEQVGLSGSYADRYPHQLSGGERQRVGIARAIATGPKFIVCDEPVSALDVSVQATVLNLLSDLRDRLGLSYLFISHDLSVVAHIADRIAVMYAGTICEEGPTDAILAPPYHPYTATLLSAIPSPDPTVAQTVRIRPRIDGVPGTGTTRGCVYHARCPHSLGAVCEDTPPQVVEPVPGHRIACHLPLAQLAAMPAVLPVRGAGDAAGRTDDHAWSPAARLALATAMRAPAPMEKPPHAHAESLRPAHPGSAVGPWSRNWPHSQRTRGLLLLLIGTILIAFMDALVKLLSASLGTLQITWGRYATSAILLFVVVAPRRSLLRLRTRKLSLHLFRVGMLLVSSGLFFGALATMSLAEANTIAFTTPLLITVLSGLILGEAVGTRRWIAVIAGFAGVLIVVRPGSGLIGWAALLPLVSATCSALYHLTTRLLARTEDPANTLYFVALVGGIGLSLAVPFFWRPLTPVSLLGLCAVGTLGTAGHFFLIRAFQIVPAATLSPFLYVYLVWATLLGWLIFGDIPDLMTWVGAAVILASGLYVYRHSGHESEAHLQ